MVVCDTLSTRQRRILNVSIRALFTVDETHTFKGESKHYKVGSCCGDFANMACRNKLNACLLQR